MLELFALAPAIMGGAYYFSNQSKMSDKKKIERIFENANLGLMEKGQPRLPEFKRKAKIEDNGKVVGMDYVYRLPLGYPSKKIQYMNEAAGIFKDGLNKPVNIEYDGMIHVKVFEQDIPEKWSFLDIKLKPGKWEVPLGRTYEGIEWYDFDKFPNMVNGGSTRFGKTVLLKVLMTSLILQNPDDVEFYIIDLKGGLEFDRYRNLKQVKGVASNAVEANNMLKELAQELGYREQLFKRNHWNNIVDTPLNKRTFVIVDEAHELVSDKWMKKKHKDMLDECMYLIQAIAALGGGLGFRMLYCTQYPTADSCPKNIKQNSTLRISFKLPDPHASSVILGEKSGEASELPNLQGRAIMKTSEMKEIQVPFLSDKEMKSLTCIYEDHRKEIVEDEQHSTEERTTDEDFELPG